MTRLTAGTSGDARGNAGQDVVGRRVQSAVIRILGGYGAQHDRVTVGATIALNAHGTNVRRAGRPGCQIS